MSSNATDRVLVGVAVVIGAACLAAGFATLALNQVALGRVPSRADPTWDESLGTVFGVLLVALALVVVVRARRNPVGWLLLGLIALGTLGDFFEKLGVVGLHVPGEHVAGANAWAALSESLDRPTFVTVLAILLLFPTGHPPSPRWRPTVWAVAVLGVSWFVAHLLGPGNPQEPPFTGVHNPFAVSWFGNPVLHYAFLPAAGVLSSVSVASLVVRYRRSSGDERQQLRWLGLLASGLPLGIVALGAASLVGGDAMEAVGNVVWVFPQIGLPVAVVIAVTRYRLYDLDLLVNRTVVYVCLCVLLAATYAAVVLLATRVVVHAGWTSPGVVAAATLAGAAVIAPGRRAIQESVDRLFGRRAWDAERLLGAFTTSWFDAPQPAEAVRDVLAGALRDPSVQVGFWLRGRHVYVDAAHRELTVPEPGSGRSALRFDIGGEPVALVVHDSALDRDRRLLAVVPRAAALVVENARLQAEVRAQLVEVEQSRARIVAAGDAERRRVEQDLHDGAQQRLVGLAMRVRLAARTSPEPDVLEDVARELLVATRELRELARGIHPAALAEGLPAAVESLVIRCPVPVQLDLAVPRLPQPVELTAYYVVAECVTNAVKHAAPRRIEVRGWVTGPDLHLAVRDDGRGGADLTRGTGLAGLADRIAVLGGRLDVDSPLSGGTTVRASVSCAS